MDFLSWMNVALQKANDSLKSGEVPVGCLFIYNNDVIATGNNTVNETRNATRHAEINCIDQVLESCNVKDLSYKNVFYDTDVIVTVEPCIMCTSALCQLQVRNIIYGCGNDRFGGCISVFEVPKLYNSRTKIIGGIKGTEAMTLLKEFYKGTNPNVPESKFKKDRKKKDT
ncbi:tRNA-specific adenosine deaminase 2 [Bombus affinis]|uniref:tRNA-specific adenosine deaminase 2 n=1 Tax=Bombus affinis TaxID=309941 RepID=UPI0021B807B4|nr:tRNA-specific adenosine deaminase 2 [Bombus affinis]